MNGSINSEGIARDVIAIGASAGGVRAIIEIGDALVRLARGAAA